MDKFFMSAIRKSVPEFSGIFTGSYVSNELSKIPEFISRYLVSSLATLPEHLGLKYVGYRKRTPEENLYKITNSKSKVIYDLARSDLYTCELMFTYNRTNINIPVKLPYVRKTNIVSLSGNLYAINPVYTDNVVTVNFKEIFVRLDVDKPTFRGFPRNILLNGSLVLGTVVYVNALKVPVTDNPFKIQSKGPISKAIAPSYVYMLIRYGLKEALRISFGVEIDVHVGNVFVDEEYHVFRSSTNVPSGVRKENYIAPNLFFTIKKDSINNIDTSLIDVMTSIVYIFDIFANSYDEFVELFKTNNVDDEKYYWKIVFVRMTFRDSLRIETLISYINKHLAGLEHYINPMLEERLRFAGLMISDFYQLVEYCSVNFSKLTLARRTTLIDNSSKYLDINYYLTYTTFIRPINQVISTLLKRVDKRNPSSRMSVGEVTNIITSTIKAGNIFKIYTETNLTLMLVDYTGDNKVMKITQNAEFQTRGVGGVLKTKPGKKADPFPIEIRSARGIDVIAGNIYKLKAKSPSALLSLNVFAKLNSSGNIIIPEDQKETVDYLDKLLSGHIDEIISDDNDETNEEE